MDEIRSTSNPSVYSGYHSYAGSLAVPEASGTMFLKTITQYSMLFLVQNKRDTVRFEHWLHAISDPRKNFNEQLVRAAINKSCVEEAADAICCLLPGTTLDDIIEKNYMVVWIC